MRSALVAMALLLVACGGGKGTTAVEAPAPVVSEDTQVAIEGVIERYRQAYEISGTEALSELYSQDLDLVLVYQGKAHYGWTSVQEFLSQRLAGAVNVRMRIKDVAIHEIGPSAVHVSATRETSIGNGAVTVTETGSLTLVLEKRENTWLVAAEHFSFPTRRS